MKNPDVAARLNEIAALMEFDGEPFFKIKAYQRAARSVEDCETPMRELLAAGTLGELPGVGKAIAQKIADIERTGTCMYLDELRAKFPPTILELLGVSGIGAKTAVALYRELAITGLADLKAAVEDGSIVRLRRLGPKSVENLKAALGRPSPRTRRVRLGDAWPIAQSIVQALADSGRAESVMVAGSARRMEPTVGGLDIVCTSADPANAIAFFLQLPAAERVTARGDTTATIWAEPGIAVDLRVVPRECFGNLLQHFTGSKEHNIKLREFALRQGKSVSEYGITDAKTGAVVRSSDEHGVYAALGLTYIPPELRTGLDEIELARAHALPELIALDDIRGDLHAHTTWSDGTRSIEEMARGAAALGREYLSISDHSAGRAVANGLSVQRLREQVREIRAASDRFGVRLLCSSEVDIRADGSLDFPDDVLAQLDVVVASVHSAFKRTKEQQTQRLVRAIRNPFVNILGHPTGALIEQRAGYEFESDVVFAAAASSGTALEINASPARLDLSAPLARRAAEIGCMLSINTDAHSIGTLGDIFYGVGTARKAGLSKTAVLNSRPVEELLAFVQRKRHEP